MLNKEVDTYSPQNQKDWRQWLKKNHRSKQSVWVVYYTKRSKIPSISWSEAVDEALCFGWIDSTKKRIDDSSFMQLFSKRKLKSNWSKINKEKIKKLIDSKRMAKAGFESIEIAKQNGSWTILDEVEELILPNDLEETLEKYKGSKDYFLSLSKSTRKLMLGRIALAKRPETRQKRVQEVVENARQKSLQIN